MLIIIYDNNVALVCTLLIILIKLIETIIKIILKNRYTKIKKIKSNKIENKKNVVNNFFIKQYLLHKNKSVCNILSVLYVNCLRAYYIQIFICM